MCSGLRSRRGLSGRTRVFGCNRGSGLTAIDGPAWTEGKRVGGLGCKRRVLDWACRSRVSWVFALGSWLMG